MRRAVKVAGRGLLVLIVVWASVAAATFVARTRSQAITPGTEIPPMFPVVIFNNRGDSEWTCAVRYFNELKSGIEATRNYSFLVPGEFIDTCTQEISAGAGEEVGSSSAEEDRNVVTLADVDFGDVDDDGRQPVRLFATWDADWVNRSWYLADPSRIVPERYQVYYGAGILISSIGLGLVSGVAVTSIVTIVLWRRGGRRAKEGS